MYRKTLFNYSITKVKKGDEVGKSLTAKHINDKHKPERFVSWPIKVGLVC